MLGTAWLRLVFQYCWFLYIYLTNVLNTILINILEAVQNKIILGKTIQLWFIKFLWKEAIVLHEDIWQFKNVVRILYKLSWEWSIGGEVWTVVEWMVINECEANLAQCLWNLPLELSLAKTSKNAFIHKGKGRLHLGKPSHIWISPNLRYPPIPPPKFLEWLFFPPWFFRIEWFFTSNFFQLGIGLCRDGEAVRC